MICPVCDIKHGSEREQQLVFEHAPRVLEHAATMPKDRAAKYLARSWLLGAMQLLGYCPNHAIACAADLLHPDAESALQQARAAVRDTEALLAAAGSPQPTHVCNVIPFPGRA